MGNYQEYEDLCKKYKLTSYPSASGELWLNHLKTIKSKIDSGELKLPEDVVKPVEDINETSIRKAIDSLQSVLNFNHKELAIKRQILEEEISDINEAEVDRCEKVVVYTSAKIDGLELALICMGIHPIKGMKL